MVRFNKIFQAKGSGSILMNIHNGEILSFVSLPDFDLNLRKQITDKILLIELVKANMSLVIFKPHAATLEMGLIEPEQNSKICQNLLIVLVFQLENTTKDTFNLTAEQILIRSGNIGSVKIAQKVEKDLKIF